VRALVKEGSGDAALSLLSRMALDDGIMVQVGGWTQQVVGAVRATTRV
jgi:pentatricopeptide repeat protein